MRIFKFTLKIPYENIQCDAKCQDFVETRPRRDLGGIENEYLPHRQRMHLY